MNSENKLTTKYCNPLCIECSTNDLNYCTKCQPGIIYYNSSCMLYCPEGTYLDNFTRSCEKCSEECPVCWGPRPDMCGLVQGVRSYVVSLQDEIKKFMSTYQFTRTEMDKWVNSLKLILKDERFGEIVNQDMFTTNDVYNIEECEIELPIGSFSKNNGTFFPIPAYINRDRKLVESHWVYREGTWDGKSWNKNFFIRMSMFIKYKGEKNKIYNENNGFWIYSPGKDWTFIKSRRVFEPYSDINDVLVVLNAIKFNTGNYAKNKIKESVEIKKLIMQSRYF
jgi:hypothetical protein